MCSNRMILAVALSILIIFVDTSMNNDDDLYLSAEEAARQLEVSVTTLYSYVSRKVLRSEQIEGWWFQGHGR